MVRVYKKGQGKYTRMLTLAGAVFVATVAAAALSEFFGGYNLTRPPYIRFGVPAGLVAVVGLLVLWLINRPKSADFLIATEGEMKKVSWSSKKEVIGSTKVVIITTFILAVVLFSVDLALVFFCGWLGISG